MKLFYCTKKKSGFTLIEILIGMVLTSIVSIGIFQAYNSQQRSQIAQQQSVDMQQNIRAAMMIMTKDIRTAGYDPNGTSEAGILRIGDGSSADERLRFTRVADDDGFDNATIDSDGDDLVDTGDGTVDETDELQYIEYYLFDSKDDGTMDLGRRNGARLDAIVQNIQSLNFVYRGADGGIVSDGEDVRFIEITIVAEVNPNHRRYMDINNSTRTLTKTVTCRNMGL